MSTIDHTATDKRDVYARVTAQIINAIEQGVGTWRMPWHTSGRYAFSPINATSKKPYRGINTVCLWAAAQAKGYERGEWATYQQWQDKGAQVRKGEKATLVVFWKFANDSGESQGCMGRGVDLYRCEQSATRYGLANRAGGECARVAEVAA